MLQKSNRRFELKKKKELRTWQALTQTSNRIAFLTLQILQSPSCNYYYYKLWLKLTKWHRHQLSDSL